MREEKQKIISMVIFEIIGKPPEHLVSTLNSIIDQINSEEKVKVIKRKIGEPKEMEENAGIVNTSGKEAKIEKEKFYITFGEVELETDDLPTLVSIIFRYMPAHIEIISPEKVNLTNLEWSGILTDLTRKLHSYDEVARVLQVEKDVLEHKVRNLTEGKNEVSSEKSETKKKIPVKKTKKKAEKK